VAFACLLVPRFCSSERNDPPGEPVAFFAKAGGERVSDASCCRGARDEKDKATAWGLLAGVRTRRGGCRTLCSRGVDREAIYALGNGWQAAGELGPLQGWHANWRRPACVCDRVLCLSESLSSGLCVIL